MSTTHKEERDLIASTHHNIDWFLRLMTVYTVLGLFISSIILALQVAGEIDASNPFGGFICWLAVLVLMACIELSMLGAFANGRQLFSKGKWFRGIVFVLAGCSFVVITIYTLALAKSDAALAAQHLKVDPNQGAKDLLNNVRISAAIIYAVLAHTLTDQPEIKPALTPVQVDQIAQLQAMVTSLVNAQKTSVDQMNVLSHKVNGLSDQVNEWVNEIEEKVNESVHLALKSPMEHHFHELKTLLGEWSNDQGERWVNGGQQVNIQVNGPVHPPFTHMPDTEPHLTTVSEEPHQPAIDAPTRNATKALPMPILEVPGVSQERVQRVLEEYAKEKAWGKVSGSYEKTVKPVAIAYKRWMQDQVNDQVND